MSRLTIGQKANRVLKFMLGMRHRQVTSAMAVHGFTPEELDNGWELLRELVGDRLGYSAADRGTADAITELDAWENRWFPIIRASLDRHFPEVAERVFFNLRQTEGPQVVVGVDTLLRRLRVAGTEAGGENVLELLARRQRRPGLPHLFFHFSGKVFHQGQPKVRLAGEVIVHCRVLDAEKTADVAIAEALKPSLSQ